LALVTPLGSVACVSGSKHKIPSECAEEQDGYAIPSGCAHQRMRTGEQILAAGSLADLRLANLRILVRRIYRAKAHESKTRTYAGRDTCLLVDLGILIRRFLCLGAFMWDGSYGMRVPGSSLSALLAIGDWRCSVGFVVAFWLLAFTACKPIPPNARPTCAVLCDERRDTHAILFLVIFGETITRLKTPLMSLGRSPCVSTSLIGMSEHDVNTGVFVKTWIVCIAILPAPRLNGRDHASKENKSLSVLHWGSSLIDSRPRCTRASMNFAVCSRFAFSPYSTANSISSLCSGQAMVFVSDRLAQKSRSLQYSWLSREDVTGADLSVMIVCCKSLLLPDASPRFSAESGDTT
jgi:hypothetical protein